MSTCFHLVCHETRQTLWVGQGHGGEMTTFYSGDRETMLLLGEFLRTTVGKAVVLLSDHAIEGTPAEEYQALEDDPVLRAIVRSENPT